MYVVFKKIVGHWKKRKKEKQQITKISTHTQNTKTKQNKRKEKQINKQRFRIIYTVSYDAGDYYSTLFPPTVSAQNNYFKS